MIARGILGQLAARIAAGEFARSSIDAETVLASPFAGLIVQQRIDRAAVELEAQAVADQALAPLAAMVGRITSDLYDEEPVDAWLVEVAAIKVKADAYDVLNALTDSFRNSELLDQERALNGSDPLCSPEHRDAVANLAVDRFRHGVSLLLIEMMRKPAAGGLN